jgi:hypothetical protein
VLVTGRITAVLDRIWEAAGEELPVGAKNLLLMNPRSGLNVVLSAWRLLQRVQRPDLHRRLTELTSMLPEDLPLNFSHIEKGRFFIGHAREAMALELGDTERRSASKR